MAKSAKKQPKKQAKQGRNKTMTGEPANEILVYPNDPTPTKRQPMKVAVRESRNLLVEYVFNEPTRRLYGNPDLTKRWLRHRKIRYYLDV